MRSGALVLVAAASLTAAGITIDYPEPDTLFPPDFAPPTFLWRDDTPGAARWQVEIAFADGSPRIRVECKGERFEVGAPDPRAIAATNEPPAPTARQAASRVWKPDAGVWSEIKRRSVRRPATITIYGYADGAKQQVSRGSVTIRTSPDPVGAPIFYRDVPLMPSELKKGVIKPLAVTAVPLIAWRLRRVDEVQSTLLMEGLHTCANCHSFSRDGKTMGMDLDGPQNDKGLYAVVPVQPQMTIRNEDMIKWSSFRGNLGRDLRVGFMSQVSPGGDYVVTMIEPPALDSAPPVAGPGRGHFYVANFKDYRFLQVFYPTRGILAWYSRATGRLQPLPGADDPRYVHTSAVWSPDGKYLVFARAPARDPYPEGRRIAEAANDTNETAIQYDLYRIPFNEGRGGVAEPVVGASRNGMSNSFPKVSPDGRWIVYVQCRNGLLMRPDSQLYIVPAQGGAARKLRSNTPLMNSWHSFSPNGRWLVFSSKSRSPYTQMFLTHLDAEGRDSPAILIENATAANRAVNIPEFVNVPPGGLLKIATPAVDYYRLFDRAFELTRQGAYEAAIEAWNEAIQKGPDESKAHMNLGVALAGAGRSGEAFASYRKAMEIDPEDAEIRLNYGVALAGAGHIDLAMAEYRKALELNPGYPEAHNNLGLALARAGKLDEAIAQYRQALEAKPDYAEIHNNLGAALARSGRPGEAVAHFRQYLEANPANVEVHGNLVRALAQSGRAAEVVAQFEEILRVNPASAALHNTLGLALLWQKRTEEAVARFTRAIELDPALAEAHQNLGDALYQLGRTREALAHWREVLRAAPNHLPALTQAAMVLATDPDPAVRDGREAVQFAERAVELAGSREPAVLDILAAAYAETGRFAGAVETARRALALATEQGKTQLADAVKARIALYEGRTPLRRAR